MDKYCITAMRPYSGKLDSSLACLRGKTKKDCDPVKINEAAVNGWAVRKGRAQGVAQRMGSHHSAIARWRADGPASALRRGNHEGDGSAIVDVT
jgi:hypothetical protein